MVVVPAGRSINSPAVLLAMMPSLRSYQGPAPMRSMALTVVVLKKALQPFAPDPGTAASAIRVQIASAPARPPRSPPNPFSLLDSRRMASRLVTKKLKCAVAPAPPAPLAPALPVCPPALTPPVVPAPPLGPTPAVVVLPALLAPPLGLAPEEPPVLADPASDEAPAT